MNPQPAAQLREDIPMTSSQACRIAAVQMVSGPDVAANLAEADRLIG